MLNIVKFPLRGPYYEYFCEFFFFFFAFLEASDSLLSISKKKIGVNIRIWYPRGGSKKGYETIKTLFNSNEGVKVLQI